MKPTLEVLGGDYLVNGDVIAVQLFLVLSVNWGMGVHKTSAAIELNVIGTISKDSSCFIVIFPSFNDNFSIYRGISTISGAKVNRFLRHFFSKRRTTRNTQSWSR